MRKNKEIEKFLKERDKAILSWDTSKFKRFYLKWMAKGYYDQPLPADSVLEISLRKMTLGLKTATSKQKLEAANWLIERGYDLLWD